MPPRGEETDGFGAPRQAFVTTHWSVVLQAGREFESGQAQALETLCRTYWYPLYVYLRRLGYSPEDAQDQTQSFLSHVLSRELLGKADPECGRFRSFLLGTLKKFLANARRREQAQKRDTRKTFSIDADDAEGRYAQDLPDPSSPQLLFEKAWALAVLDETVTALESDYTRSGKTALFAALLPLLQGDRGANTYEDIGRSLSMSEGAIKVAVHRLRQRYRELLRSIVAQTVADPLDVDSELRHLLQVIQ